MLNFLPVVAPTTDKALIIIGQSAKRMTLVPVGAKYHPVSAAAVAKKLHHIPVSEVFWMQI